MEKTIIRTVLYFDTINKNDRIYTELEVMPKVNELRRKIKQQGCLYGELNHPDTFDIQLTNVSHNINKLFRRKKILYAEIQVLNTTCVKELYNNLDKYVFRSRAAGTVNEDKIVELKAIFTFDAILKSEDSFNG